MLHKSLKGNGLRSQAGSWKANARRPCARACREALNREAAGPARRSSRSRPLCFQCYRADLDRDRALQAAGELDTASDARFQSQLPFEPVNRARLEMLKAERSGERARGGAGDRPVRGQAAPRADRGAACAAAMAAGLTSARQLAPAIEAQVMAAAAHAAELQLPDAWLPFVVSR